MVWAVLFSIMLVLAGFVLFELLAGAGGPDARKAPKRAGAARGALRAASGGARRAAPRRHARRAPRARPGGALLRRDRDQPRRLGRDHRPARAGGAAHHGRAPDPRRASPRAAVMLASLWPGDAAGRSSLGAGARGGRKLRAARARALVAALQRDRRDRRHGRRLRLHRARLPAQAARDPRRGRHQRLGGCRRADRGGGGARDVARGHGRPVAGDAGARKGAATQAPPATGAGAGASGCRCANGRPKALARPARPSSRRTSATTRPIIRSARFLTRPIASSPRAGAVLAGSAAPQAPRSALRARRSAPLRARWPRRPPDRASAGRRASAAPLHAERDLAGLRVEAKDAAFGRNEGVAPGIATRVGGRPAPPQQETAPRRESACDPRQLARKHKSAKAVAKARLPPQPRPSILGPTMSEPIYKICPRALWRDAGERRPLRRRAGRPCRRLHPFLHREPGARDGGAAFCRRGRSRARRGRRRRARRRAALSSRRAAARSSRISTRSLPLSAVRERRALPLDERRATSSPRAFHDDRRPRDAGAPAARAGARAPARAQGGALRTTRPPAVTRRSAARGQRARPRLPQPDRARRRPRQGRQACRTRCSAWASASSRSGR